MKVSTKNPQHSSDSAEHYTPSNIIGLSRSVMGSIDLDPASCVMANSVVKAERFFTQVDDGLSQQWWGNVFLNPPGGKIRNRSSQAVWWDKLHEEFKSGRVNQAIFVGFSLEVLAWRQTILNYPMCIHSGRIRFLKQVGAQLVENSKPTHANVLVYLPSSKRDSTRRFITTFSQLGRCGVLAG